ncbi:MAG: hypothetical protein HDR22_03515 [Lachnospiraceae bacterium]|nr:hypothetical protein [Lachnospiraceae bacterium]
MHNILIKGTGIYVPHNKVYNEELNEHFAKRGLDASHLMEHLGRRKRYFISEGENAISMCQNAIDNCIKKSKINMEDIEMLVFCSDTPEYLIPSNALKLTGLYGEKLQNVNIAFDMNSNCTSMLQGMNVVSKYMQGTDISHALVVGCFCISPIALWGDTVVYANFADAAACVLLSTEEEEEQRGFIDTKVYINAMFHHLVTYPKCGMSKVPLKKIEPNEKRLEWQTFSMDDVPQNISILIKAVLEKNHLTTEDIDYYIFSQLSDAYNMETLKLLDVSEEKYHFVGGEYAYTGNTCPILCLNRMWDLYAKKGNKLIMCTMGAGFSLIVQLYEF